MNSVIEKRMTLYILSQRVRSGKSQFFQILGALCLPKVVLEAKLKVRCTPP